jgi:ribosomal protein S25
MNIKEKQEYWLKVARDRKEQRDRLNEAAKDESSGPKKKKPTVAKPQKANDPKKAAGSKKENPTEAKPQKANDPKKDGGSENVGKAEQTTPTAKNKEESSTKNKPAQMNFFPTVGELTNASRQDDTQVEKKGGNKTKIGSGVEAPPAPPAVPAQPVSPASEDAAPPVPDALMGSDDNSDGGSTLIIPDDDGDATIPPGPEDLDPEANVKTGVLPSAGKPVVTSPDADSAEQLQKNVSVEIIKQVNDALELFRLLSKSVLALQEGIKVSNTRIALDKRLAYLENEIQALNKAVRTQAASAKPPVAPATVPPAPPKPATQAQVQANPSIGALPTQQLPPDEVK